MAKFAAIDVTNTVTRVIEIDDAFVSSNGGDQSTQAEEAVKKQIPLKSSETRWVQTSDSFRGVLAGKGFTFNVNQNIFIRAKEFPSWVLNSEGTAWEAPVAFPSIIEDTSIVLGQRNVETDADHPVGSNIYSRYFPYWNEENLRWQSTNSKGILHYWNPDNSTWNIV